MASVEKLKHGIYAIHAKELRQPAIITDGFLLGRDNNQLSCHPDDVAFLIIECGDLLRNVDINK